MDDVGDDGRVGGDGDDRGGVGFEHVRADARNFVVGTQTEAGVDVGPGFSVGHVVM